MRASIEEKVNVFMGKLKNAKTPQKVVGLCLSEKRYLFNVKNSNGENYKLSTIRHYFTHYRKAVNDSKFVINKALVLRHLKLTRKENSVIERKTNKSTVTTHENRAEIEDFGALVALASNLVKNAIEAVNEGNRTSYYKLTLGLMMLTGRREGEILKTAKFTASKNRKYEVIFRGQLKKKEEDTGGYIIPILEDSKLVRQGLRTLRGLRDFSALTNSQINSKVSKDLGLYCKDIFGAMLGDDLKPHDLRKAYATIAAHKHNPLQISFNRYASAILGHNEDDIKTANSYNKYYIK
jgi:hypothetical protein